MTEWLKHDPLPLSPLDADNQALLDHVHPENWRNPAPRPLYHLVVIGGGTAGLVSAAIGAALGASVALVERRALGGDCLNIGCVPSKALIRAARAAAAARTAGEFGVRTGDIGVDFAAVMARMRKLRRELSATDSAARFKSLGVDVFLGDSRFTGPDTIEISGSILRFRRAVIASGGRPVLPALPGLAEARPLTNETIFNLTALPRRLAVIGAGPIGCELAQSFRRFGAEVTMLTDGKRMLPREDDAAAALLAAQFQREGITVITSARLTSVESAAGKILHYEKDGAARQLAADEILVAIGRAPNVEGLQLEKAGVVHDRAGVTVDDGLRTSNPRIYAAGDICSVYKFTHAADAMARIAVRNALFPFLPAQKFSRVVMPWCTYTEPEIAHAGASARDLETKKIAHETIEVPFAEVDRAKLDGETGGLLKLRVSPHGRILGATLVAAHAGEMIGELTLAISRKIPLGDLASVIHPYPTQAEAIRKAGDLWNRRRLTPGRQRLLARILRWVHGAPGRGSARVE